MKRVKDNNYIFMKKTTGEKIVHAVVFVIFAVYAISLVFPLLWLLVQSFFQYDAMPDYNTTILGNAFALPKEWYFENYSTALSLFQTDSGINLIGMLVNSAWFILLCETWCIFWPIMTGYIFAKYKFRGREIFYAVIIFTLTVPVMGTTAAYYKLIDFLGIYDTGPLFVITTGINGFTSSFLIYYGIFKGISWDYAEAVFVDGGGNFMAFVKVMLPQALPAIAAMMVSSFISHWNEYYQFLMYMPSTPVVAAGLYLMKDNRNQFGMPTYYAALVICTIPVMVVYALMAESMMKNLSIGGLKG